MLKTQCLPALISLDMFIVQVYHASMIIQKAFKFRLEPNQIVAEAIAKVAGSARFVWNKALAIQKERLNQGFKVLSYVETWFVSIQTEQEVVEPVHPSKAIVGMDMGVARFATLSDGEVVEPLNSFKSYTCYPCYPLKKRLRICSGFQFASEALSLPALYSSLCPLYSSLSPSHLRGLRQAEVKAAWQSVARCVPLGAQHATFDEKRLSGFWIKAYSLMALVCGLTGISIEKVG